MGLSEDDNDECGNGIPIINDNNDSVEVLNDEGIANDVDLVAIAASANDSDNMVERPLSRISYSTPLLRVLL